MGLKKDGDAVIVMFGMELSIIIVSWNVKPLLRNCLASIYKYTKDLDFEVFVVDNNSHDGSADMVAKNFTEVKLIRNKRNNGFGKANNQAFNNAQGRYVLFLNDDTEIHDNIFKKLIDKYNRLSSSDIGMIGCRLLNPDGSQQESVRSYPTVFDQTIILLKLHRIFPWLVNGYRQKNFDYDKEQMVEQVMGAFMLVPRAILDEQGSFDEGFFAWFEEVDMQKRFNDAGYSVLYTPAVSCVHVKGASFGQLRRPKAQQMFNRSMRLYFRKHHSFLSYLWIVLIQPFSIMLSHVAQIFR